MRNGRERISGTTVESGVVRYPSFLAGAMTGALLAAAAASLISAELADARQPTQASVETLITTSETVAGEAIAYPAGAPAMVTAAIITLPRGASTGWHTHGVPLFGYILEGELTVDYGLKGVRTYRAGDGFMEAEEAPHDGRNAGNGDFASSPFTWVPKDWVSLTRPRRPVDKPLLTNSTSQIDAARPEWLLLMGTGAACDGARAWCAWKTVVASGELNVPAERIRMA